MTCQPWLVHLAKMAADLAMSFALLLPMLGYAEMAADQFGKAVMR